MAAPAGQTVTSILKHSGPDDPSAAEELLPLVYEELRRLAHDRMQHEPPSAALQPTALVHEAYLRLVEDPEIRWGNRAHFFGAAARAMRQILVERARRRRSPKHGGDRRRIPLESVPGDEPSPDHVLALHESLNRLGRIDGCKAEVALLRFFGGLTIEETSRALGLSIATIKREWRFARAWLYREMSTGR